MCTIIFATVIAYFFFKKKAPPDASSGATLRPQPVGAMGHSIPKRGRSPKATALFGGTPRELATRLYCALAF